MNLPIKHNYAEPVSYLISYGEPEEIYSYEERKEWPDYVKKFSLSLDDVPNLIRILYDPVIKNARSTEPAIWANIHALRAIGQLGAIDAIDDLIRYLDYCDDKDTSYWIIEEIPIVFSKIGKLCIEPLSNYINNMTKGNYGISTAATSLSHIAKSNSEFRIQCIEIITNRLKKYNDNEDELNALLICELIELKATESLDVIQKAFEANAVEDWVVGDLEEVEIQLMVRQTRTTPEPQYEIHGLNCSYDYEEEEYIKPTPFKRPVKIGRNEPCPCGSGKKYKKCCLTY